MIYLREQHHVDGVLEGLHVQRAVGAAELHQVDRARLQPSRRRACTRCTGSKRLMRPELGLVCQRLIVVSYCSPGRRSGRAASAISRISSRAGTVAPLARRARDQLPLAVLSTALHELVGHAHGVVGVLVLDRLEAVAVDRHVKAGVAQRGGLVLLLGLAPDELADVRVVDVEHDHLRRSRVLPPDLIVPAHESGAAHERDGPEAVPPLASGSIEPRMFDRLIPEPEPPRKIIPSLVFQSRIDSIVSCTERMKQALPLRVLLEADVEPTRAS